MLMEDRSRGDLYCRPSVARLATLIPREEYINSSPYGAIEDLRLHAINHAQKDTLQEFRFEQTQKVHGGDLRIGGSDRPTLHYFSQEFSNLPFDRNGRLLE